MSKNVLVLGSGGREHALTWKIAQSEQCGEIYVAPGNPGTAAIATNTPLQVTDFEEIQSFITEKSIDLLVVGPEDPLVNGIRNFLEQDDALKESLSIVGPGKEGALLEGSKDFSKDFMNKHGIPTAYSATFTKDTLKEGLSYLEKQEAPYVLKADGLAAGKGVIISDSLSEAKESLTEMLVDEKFGSASSSVLVEQYLEGIELSVFVLTDGNNYMILPEAKDYKRIGENDEGLNTGGMGAVSPVQFAKGDFLNKVEERVVKPTIAGLKKDGIDYKGFLFIGLMNVQGDPYVIEYNVRMGDPETQVVIPRIQSDLLEVFYQCGKGILPQVPLDIDERTATTVVMVSGGYPESYEKGHEIVGAEGHEEGMVFHAGTKQDGEKLVTSGGRVLAITSYGSSLQEALNNSYQKINGITWKNSYYRGDIGKDLLKQER